MPIQVACSSCAGKFRVPDNVAGKKIRCPKCKEVIQVPAGEIAESPKLTPQASQPASPQNPATPKAALAAKPALENWFLKTEDGESYGPVPRAELDAWYAEGRVTIDCQVLREGSDQWQWASELYPELDPASAAKVVPTTPEVAEAPVEQPAAVAKAAAQTPATPAKPTAPAKPVTATMPSPTPKQQPTAAATPKPAKEESASPMSFFPPDEPAAAEAPATAEDNPFAFLGGGGAGGGGGEAFNFSTAPATAASSSSAKAKTSKKAATATASSEAVAADPGEVSSKSKLTAGLLAIFLGSLGVHRFYLGYTMLGVVQLLLCGGCGIWQIIDIVMIFTGKLPDSQGKPLKG